MSRTALDFLWSTDPPWIYVGFGEPQRLQWTPSHFYSQEGRDVCVRRLRGWKMTTVEAFMSEAGAALQLSDQFGENWYALEESLCYLDEWLPATAYVIVVERAELALSGDRSQISAMLTTFNAAAQYWSQPVDSPNRFRRQAAPFHLLLNVDASAPGAVERISNVANDAEIPLRVGSPP